MNEAKVKAKYLAAKKAINKLTEIVNQIDNPEELAIFLDENLLTAIYQKASPKFNNDYKSLLAFEQVLQNLNSRENKVKYTKKITKAQAQKLAKNLRSQKKTYSEIAIIISSKYKSVSAETVRRWNAN